MAFFTTPPARCPWARAPEEVEYHDFEWGAPFMDDRKFFEFIVLESAQAGLSWLTILRKREGYREAFAGFDPEKVAKFEYADFSNLIMNERIVRNQKKIESAMNNAKIFLKLQQEHGSFSSYIWSFVDGKAVDGKRKSHKDIPPSTPLSDRMAREFKANGFQFLGSTTLYALLQATGLVNDHLVSCFRYQECKQIAKELGVL